MLTFPMFGAILTIDTVLHFRVIDALSSPKTGDVDNERDLRVFGSGIANLFRSGGVMADHRCLLLTGASVEVQELVVAGREFRARN